MQNESINPSSSSSEFPDSFAPHMPVVNILPDMDSLFAQARNTVIAGCSQLGGPKDQKCIAIITPKREIVLFPSSPPHSKLPEEIEPIKKLIPSDRPLDVTVVSYTDQLEASMTATEINNYIPFFGYLLALAYIGHHVVVFEGDASAFESGVKNTDVLFVDSGMAPFLQKNWFEVACRIMRNPHKVFRHERATYSLQQIVPNDELWQTCSELLKHERWQEARECYEKLLSFELTPEDRARALANIMQTYAHEGNQELAIKYGKQARELAQSGFLKGLLDGTLNRLENPTLVPWRLIAILVSCILVGIVLFVVFRR